ncbi:MAG: NAD(P)-binding domain-containing protein [Acidipropionibacterium acidipropionici]|uniref:NAD(P)-binding domain-containing protein n=1 Tax=Acidipropionibacterium acidipropionici TaxID=1748 RepID=UPI002F360A63
MIVQGLGTVGFIGVGAIATAMTDGLLAGDDGPSRVVLSPRGARNAAQLSARHRHVSVAASNQEVAAGADILVLSVLPGQLHDAVAGLRLHDGQVLVSVLAGVSLHEIREALDTDLPIVRTIPLPPVAQRGAVTVMTEAPGVVTQMFDLLGGCLPVPDEAQLSVFSAMTGSFTGLLQYVATLSRWAGTQGVPVADAERFIRGAVAGLAPGLRDSQTSMDQLIRAHETPGGLNEQLRREFFDDRTTAALQSALDNLLHVVTR